MDRDTGRASAGAGVLFFCVGGGGITIYYLSVLTEIVDKLIFVYWLKKILLINEDIK